MEKKTNAVATMIRPVEAENLTLEQRERARRAIERIGERNRDADPEQVLADVTAVVEEVRRERYEAEQRAAAEGGR